VQPTVARCECTDEMIARIDRLPRRDAHCDSLLALPYVHVNSCSHYSVCYPIGAFLGAIAAIINEHLPNYAAQQSSVYNPVNDNDLDEEQY
jgi:hypothetical protein